MAKILVVDDEAAIREMLQDMLGREGHEVTTAENGQHALSLFLEDQADIVITNILMPEKEGLETIRELREMCPGVKIIAMSGGGQLGTISYLDVARSFGAMETLTKPFTRQRLIDALHDVLGAPAPS